MIFEVPNVISPEDCELFIQFYENADSSYKKDPRHEFFDGRTLEFFSGNNATVIKRYRVLEQKLIQLVSKLYYKEGFIYTETCALIKWEPGMHMDIHTDNYPEHPGYKSGEITDFRDFSSICYLNDDYEGGGTFFPDDSKICIPERGKVVFFPSGYKHGVSEVKKSNRYTVATWFSLNEDHVYSVL
jgi:predicted 2-oxoglutarate/Fe(II)-dependent dioxygenase YbiX